MNWLDEIKHELRRIQPGEHPGRTRTIARRAAGIALKHYYHETENDFLVVLHRAQQDELLPEEVRKAAERLATRLSAEFQSPSIDPAGDAKRIIEFVEKNNL